MPNFFVLLNMGGHGIYVWSAYALVISVLTLQLLSSWKRWKNLKHQQEMNHDHVQPQ